MSRSGYVDDFYDNWEIIRWRGMVASATRGKRGQQFFRDLAAALDTMPVKRLIAEYLIKDGEYCALGVLGAQRGIPIADLDPEDSATVAAKFDIAECLAQETVFENDEAGFCNETPEQRWARVRAWVAKQIRESGAGRRG